MKARPASPPAPGRTLAPTLLPALAVMAGIVSLSAGTSFAERLFPLVGPQGTTALRVGFAAALLVALWRPWRRPLSRGDALAVALYGAVLGTMNLVFYMALRTIPFGIAVAIEFTGPLAVAALSSRRPLDALWVGLAVLGLVGLLPLGGGGPLDPAGLGFAGAAALAWALYIVLGQRAGRRRGGDAAALGLVVASVVVIPFGVAQAGAALLSPPVLLAGLAVALLSSAVPYSLEMYALQRLPRHTFGVLLAAEPAVSALAGLLVLGQTLGPAQWAAVGTIVLASVGCAATARPAARIDPAGP